MEEEGSQKPEEDHYSRRSSRKRRKINYKPNDPPKVYAAHIAKVQRNGNRRGRPRKIPCVPEVEPLKTKQPSKKKKYCIDEIDRMISDFIELNDKTSIKRLISTLQNSLQDPTAKVIEEIASDTKNIIQMESSEKCVNEQVDLSKNLSTNMDAAVLQSTSSIPANLQTKSISVHGNSVIMQGVIDTGMAQQSCFLIPIDINNISRFPGPVQYIQSSQNYVGNSAQIINTGATNPTSIAQSSAISHPTLCSTLDNQIQVINPTLSYQPQQTPMIATSSIMDSSVASMPTSTDKVEVDGSSHVAVSSSHVTISSSHVTTGSSYQNSSSVSPRMTMIPPSMQNAGKHDVMPVIELGDDFVKDINSFEAERSSNSRVKGGQSEPIHVSSTSSQSNPQNVTVSSLLAETKKTDTNTVIESLLVALQSTSSLPEIIDQLSQEEMLAIMEILGTTPQHAPQNDVVYSTCNGAPPLPPTPVNIEYRNCEENKNSSETTVTTPVFSPDLEKLAGDLERISKLDIDSLPSGAVTQLAGEISKVLFSGGEATSQNSANGDLDEEDEDFHHVQIMPQYLSNDTPPPLVETVEETNEEKAAVGSFLKCYICGLTYTEEKGFMAHMRFHLFKHRYSCYECGYGTSSMNELLVHKSNDHEGDLTKISPDFLRQLPKLEKSSENSDLEDTLITCPECKQDIPLHSLGSHMAQSHKSLHKASPGRKPKCTICTALVDNKAELAAHVNHHGKVDNCFSCYFCEQNFSSISSLQAHTSHQHATLAARRHYKCTQCSREFSGSYHLIRHVKTVHEQRRDYQCSKCDKSFVELHCLRRHIRNIHNLIRDHTCPVCNRGFTYRQDMFRHIMSVHQKIRDIKCPLCNEKFYHRYFIGHAYRQHALKVKYRDGICYIYDDAGNVIHKIT